MSLSKLLWLSGSAIFIVLGTVHLFYIFFTTKLHPRDAGATDAMKGSPLRLSQETTIWKAWIGFNASHGAGLVFIGTINIILAVEDFSLIANSFFLSLCTLLVSLFYLWLAKKYWFSIPFLGVLAAVCCFFVSPILSFFS